jgi:hypothetical protein
MKYKDNSIDAIREAILRGYDGVEIDVYLGGDFIKYCKMKNITVFTYTHKGDMELHYMNKFNIDYIITNGTT